jgi:predicted nucleotidyltransferase
MITDQIYSISQIAEKLTPVFRRYDIKRAVLFGSYGKGTATQNSDIDLLVESGLRGLQFVGFREEIQTAVQKNVDVFDCHHVNKKSDIDKEIQNTGTVIYEK